MNPPFKPMTLPTLPELRQLAWQALRASNIEEKVTLALALPAQVAPDLVANIVLATSGDAFDLAPGRPARPELVHAAKVPRRSPVSVQGRAALIHSIVHIEFNAINLALDALWRFNDMPEAFYLDWARVAREEAYHFNLLRAHLTSLRPLDGTQPQGWDYGDFAAHDSLWEMCEKTRHDPIARMALVPRTLEARGLDAVPKIQAKLRQVGAPDALRAAAALDIILHDEVGHVTIGNHWYRWLCERAGLEPVAHYAALSLRYGAPKLKGPFNCAARLKAGFTPAELAALG